MSMQANILVVDDEPQNCRLLETLLKHEGYQVTRADSGEAALKAIALAQPDLVLLDVMMPGMDGHQVTRILKADVATAHIPIIIITAHSDRAARLAGLGAGAEDFLTKPVDRIELSLRVRNLLQLKSFAVYLKNHKRILEQQVRERSAALLRFRVAMDVIDEGIFLVDGATGRFVDVNDAACRMLGYTREELLAQEPAAVGVPAGGGGAAHARLESTQLRHRDGSFLQAEVSRQVHRDGEAGVFVIVARFIASPS